MKRFALPILIAIVSVVGFNGCQPVLNDDTNNWITYEVRDGLSPGDQIILSIDREGVEAGASVEIEPEEAS